MSDQATKLRMLVGQARVEQTPLFETPIISNTPVRLARTLTVTSGKGGVGKSHVSVNLAIALAARGQRVVLFDADLGLANVDVMLGLRPEHTLAHVVSGTHGILDILVEGPGGIKVVPGASGVPYLANLQPTARARLLGSLSELERVCDVLIIDTGAGISDTTIAFTAAADVVLVVATPEITSVTDAYATIKNVSQCEGHGKLALVVNMASNRLEAERVAFRIRDVARDFLDIDVTPAGYVVRDQHVPLALRKQVPMVLSYPSAQASACIRTLATKTSRLLGIAAPRRRGGFFDRIKTLFRRA